MSYGLITRAPILLWIFKNQNAAHAVWKTLTEYGYEDEDGVSPVSLFSCLLVTSQTSGRLLRKQLGMSQAIKRLSNFFDQSFVTSH